MDDRVEVALLLAKAVDRIITLVGGAKSQKVEGHDPPAGSREVGNQVVVDPQMVREPVHEHQGRAGARIVADTEAALAARNAVLFVTWLIGP